MEKRIMVKLLIVCMSFLLLPVSLALSNCENDFMRGDSNSDWSIDITDPIYTLQYLFSGGTAPNCLQQANVNGDDAVDISDVLYTLKYLFQNGQEPVGGLYGKGEDNSPELEFLGMADEITQVKELPAVFEVIELTDEDGREISEGIMSGGDIANCKVDVYEKEQSGNYVYVGTTFEADWPDGTGLTSEPLQFLVGDEDGVIVEDVKHEYKLEVSCTDIAGQIGTTSLPIETIKEDIPLEPNCRDDIDVCCYSNEDYIIPEHLIDNDPNSPVFEERYVDDSSKGMNFVCRRDCDARVEMQQDGSMKMICDGERKPSCGDIKPREVVAGFDTRSGQQVPRSWENYGNIETCNQLNNQRVHPPTEEICLEEEGVDPTLTKADKNERKIQLLADEPTPQKSPCYVDSMTIISDPNYYKNNVDGIKDDFDLHEWFLPEKEQNMFIGGIKLPLSSDANNNNNIAFGPVEGWVRVLNDISGGNYKSRPYKMGYGFFVIATLKKGSKHENCFKGQFHKYIIKGSQVTQGTLKGTNSNLLVFTEGSTKMGKNGEYMENINSIMTKSYGDLKTVANAEMVRENEIEGSIVTHVLIDGKWEKVTPNSAGEIRVNEVRTTYCFNSGTLWCSDDYSEVQKGGLKYIEEKFYSSFPTSMIGICEKSKPKIIWYDIPGPIPMITSTDINQFKNGPLPIPGLYQTEQSFISIAEDSGPRTIDEKDANGNIIYAKGFQYRWLCEQDNLLFTKNDKVDLASGDLEKMRRVTTTKPSCECIKQKRVPGGLYEDDTANGGKISC